MATQGTDNLVIVDNMPSVEKLWNGRYRLEFFCKIQNPNEGWYSDSIDKWLPEFGTLQDADFAGEGWSTRDGEAYPDMRLVECEAKYIAPSETHLVTLTYETLTASWVAEKDEDIDYELNGLQRVSRTFVALPGTSYTKVVGTDTITVGGDTLTLGAFKIEETDATWSLTETWLESGILSVSQQFIGGSAIVQVQSLNKTSAEVNTALSEVTVSHVLISEGESDYEGIKTSSYTYEVDDFDVFDQSEDGFNTLTRSELSATNFTYGDVGVDIYATLYLASEQIDNGGAIKLRKSKWSERGVIVVKPLSGEEFSLAPSYSYTTLGQPASAMAGLTKPDGTALGASVTWLEPSVQNFEGFPTYTQEVITEVIAGSEIKVDSYEKFFQITDPGVMSTGGAYNSAATSGSATRYPQATSQPQTYRKKATVDVYLTTSSTISESEVAYTEEGVNWCSIGFDTFYNNETDSSASVSSNWRSFPQYLNSAGTTDTANASVLGVYYARANSYGAGDTTYTKTGVYRVELVKYQRKSDGTQLYLRTVITF